MTSPTPPNLSPPPPPSSAVPGNDRTQLWGWLGIIIGLLCCGVLGIVFGALSLNDAKKYGNSPVLGWIAIGAGVLNIIGGIFWSVRVR